MTDMNAALLAFLGVLVGGYFNNFLAEDYRRFRDGQALAGALGGELKSHSEGGETLKIGLQNIRNAAEAGRVIRLPQQIPPTSPIFDANAAKIGLLSPDDARDVAFVYESIRALRAAFMLLSGSFEGREEAEKAAIVAAIASGAAKRIDVAKNVGEPLVARLERHSKQSYLLRPKTIVTCAIGLVFVVALGFVAVRSSDKPDATRPDCTTTLEHDALHTVCK